MAAEVRRRAARGQGAALRGQVLTAAMDLLRETGDEASVSLRAVAERVGVTVPSIYLHFADKSALMDAVCSEVFEQLHVAMKDASIDADDALDALHRQGVAYVQFALANPEHYRIVMMRAPAAYDQDEEIASGAFAYLLSSVTACVELGVFKGEPIEFGLKLWAAAHGIAALLIAKPMFPWPPTDQLIDDVIRSAGLGLALASRVDSEATGQEVLDLLHRLS